MTGPALSGKTWLVSHWLAETDRHWRSVTVELKAGAGLAELLEAVNGSLCSRGESWLDTLVRSAELSPDMKAQAAVECLADRGWLLVLDSYEAVAENPNVRTIAEAAQRHKTSAVLVVTSRVRPSGCAQRGYYTQLGPRAASIL